jgi:hypothetical protein
MSKLLRNVNAKKSSATRTILKTLPSYPYLVCSMTTLNGILGIHEMKHITVKIEKRRKTIPPDQYLLDNM